MGKDNVNAQILTESVTVLGYKKYTTDVQWIKKARKMWISCGNADWEEEK